MRKLIFAINITLDGCCDHTKVIADEELHDYFTNLMQDADTFIYGRKIYQLMVPFWPDMAKNNSGSTKAENDFAKRFDAMKKVVFSHTLHNTDDKNTRIVNTDLRDEVLKLKQQEGKHILTGGVDLSGQLIEMDLVDEFHFVVNPVIAGAGARLLENANLPQMLKLKLADSKIFNSGCIALRYVKE